MIVKCIDFFKIIEIIKNIFVTIYNILLNISCILDGDIRRDIFIGVTGLMVAIVIFIAELISNKKYELEKQLILSKTKIIRNMAFCIFIYFLMYVFSMIKCSNCDLDKTFYIENDILFVITQLILNTLILIFLYKTFNIFKNSVKLNTDREYFNKELDLYINKAVEEIEEKANNKSLKDIKKIIKKYNKYLKNNNKLSDNSIEVGFSDELYKPIYAHKRGLIKNFNYKKIDSIIDNIENISIEETKKYLPEKQFIFVFAKKIGDKVEKNSIIGYCLSEYAQYFKDYPDCVIYDEHALYLGDEIKLINENLFELANSYLEPSDFDDNNRLFNYFNYLYQNSLDGVRKYALYQMEETERIVCKDKYKNIRYAIFLNRISSLAYNKNEFEEYQQINKIIFRLFYHQLSNDNDIKNVAYNFANHYFKFDYFSIKKNTDIRYYDELMSNLLRFICILIKEKEFEAINVLQQNILLENSRYISDVFDDKDILNLQFAIGIIQCLMIFIDNTNITGTDKKYIAKIINWTSQYFINTYDAWLIITNFKAYYDKKTSIQEVYNHLEFDLIDHEYLSSWSGWSIGRTSVLKVLLYAFNIKLVFKDSINYDEITKDDKYYYNSLLESLKSTKKLKIENELNLKLDSSNIIESSELVIADSEKKEEEYNKNNKLSKSKMNDFKRILKTTILNNCQVDNYLKKINKVEESNDKIKKVCGINELIPRDVFFDEVYGYEQIANQFGDAFASAKEKDFVSKVDSISVLSEKNIDDVLKTLKNVEDFLLITNYINYNSIKSYDLNKDCVIIDDKKLEVMKISKIDYIYLIEKKYLPKLQYCDFDEEYNKNNVDNHLFYEFNDCSKNEKIRNEIIEKSSWLSEKGNIEEQNDYLRKYCRLRVFLSYKFVKIKNSKAIKFKSDDGYC